MVTLQNLDSYSFVYDLFLKSLLHLVKIGRLFLAVAVAALLSSCGSAVRQLEDPVSPVTPPGFALPSAGDLFIHGVLSKLSVSELAGQLLMIGLERTTASEPLVKLSAVEHDLIASIAPGGVVLYASNIDTVDQTRRLVKDLHDASALPLLVATDHEGGLVSRLNAGGNIAATEIPPAAVVGASGDTRLAYELGAAIGRELRALGIVMNFAPVADVDGTSGLGMMALQLRTYGSDAEAVGEMVAATVAGMQASGVSAVLKHFPGHGGAMDDSHDELATISTSIEELRAYDLQPFVAGFSAGADAVMTAHITYPAITPDVLPATLSPFFLTTLLRRELGFRGLVITDALNMDSVATLMPEGELAVACIRAGADILLKPVNAVAVHQALIDAILAGTLDLDRVASSVRRILEIKLHRGLFSPDGILPSEPSNVIGARAHALVVERIKRLAKTRGM